MDILLRRAGGNQPGAVEVSRQIESLSVHDAFEAEQQVSPQLDSWLRLWPVKPRRRVLSAV
eukprot:1705049-Rhodomonas_salina.1